MKRIISLSLIAASLFAVSCSKEIRTDAVKNKVILGASLEQQFSETKTSLGTGNTVVWTAGDKLSVLSTANATGGDEFTLQTGAGAVSGTFKGELSTAEEYFAVYPYSNSAKLEGGNIIFDVPATQTYVENSFSNNANVSIAAFIPATANELSFFNIFGVFKLQLKGDCKITSIKLTDLSGASLSGTASIPTLSVKYGSPTVSIQDGSPSITLNCPSSIKLNTDTATSFYFVVPVGAFENGFSVNIRREDGFNILSTIKANLIKRSTILQMPNVTIGAAEVGIDLSNKETSNCYLVSEQGTYMFYAKAKGNEGNNATSLSPSSAELIWTTKNTNTAPTQNEIISAVTLKGDYVVFETTGVPGNAFIAVKDVSGNIIWSWHIWCVSDKITNQGPFQSGETCMDRMLGALSKEKGNALAGGLIYQWGRKDPFMGPANYMDSSKGKMVARMEGTYTFKSSQVASFDIESIIKSPTEIFVYTGNWNFSDNTLWGDNKTIYDPCPVGYKVMPSGTFSNCTSGAWDKGRTLTYNAVSTFIPAMGMNGDSQIGDVCYLWTSKSSNYSAPFFFTNNSTSPTELDNNNDQRYRLAVRCCKISNE